MYFFEIAGSADAFANTCITSGLGIASVVFLVLCLDLLGRRRIVCYCLSTQWTCLLLIGLIGLVHNRNKHLNSFLIFLACLWCKFSSCPEAAWALITQPSASTSPPEPVGRWSAKSPLLDCELEHPDSPPVSQSWSASRSDTVHLI